jgi:bis(5'-nucleosyl)-tetraphosphatase (symmetrical)
MAIYAIGDVQGCFDELKSLVALIKFDPAKDQLWFVGDLVNRGPKSLQVLRYVRSLGAAALTVLGNHDLHLLAVAYHGQDRLRRDDTLSEILTAPDRDDLLNWLRRQPLFHYDAGLGWAMLHAGLPPQWNLDTAQRCANELQSALRDTASMHALFEHMYGNQPDRWSPQLSGADRLRFITNCFTRLRVCDARGALNLKYKGEMHSIPDGLHPWFKAPGRRFTQAKIVCGHWSAIDYYDAIDAEGVLSIDTGCVWGGRLCAVRLDGAIKPYFVPSQQPHRLGD